MEGTYVYITRWNEFTGQPGIALLRFDSRNGALQLLEHVNENLTCNSACVDRERGILYVANEVKENPDFIKGGGGLVYAFLIDPFSGHLQQLSRVNACCPCPAYLSLDPTGNYLVCANHSSYFAVTKTIQKANGTWGMEIVYDDATIDLFSLNNDGSIGDLADVVKHTQTRPDFLLHSHPHCAVWEPAGKFFVCCDKGDDAIYTYRIDYNAKRLVPLTRYADDAGSMPRYCVFHPQKPFFFVNYEKAMCLSAFRYGEEGEQEKVGAVPVLPRDVLVPKPVGAKPGQKNAQQALEISNDGKFIYDVINGAGIDGVSVFAVDQENGNLTLLQYLQVDGIWARGARLSPDGKFLIVTCLDRGGAVLSLHVNEDGTLTPTGYRVELAGAANAVFYTGS